MLLRLFKNNSPIMHLFTIIIAVLLWLPVFRNPEWVPTVTDTSFLNCNFNALFGSAWIGQLIAFGLMLIEAFFLLRIDLKFMLVEERTIMPPLFFVLIVSVLANSHSLISVLVANAFFIITLLQILDSNRNPDQYKRYFESGLSLGIAAVIYPPITAMLFFLFSTLFVLRYFNIREFFASILGFVVPFIFFLFYMFMTDRTPEFFTNISRIAAQQDINTSLTIVQYSGIIFFALLAVVGGATMTNYIRMYKVTTRKYFSLFIWMTVLSILAFFLIPCSTLTLLTPAAIALTFIITLFFTKTRYNAFKEILFGLILISSFLVVYFR